MSFEMRDPRPRGEGFCNRLLAQAALIQTGPKCAGRMLEGAVSQPRKVDW